MENTFSIEEALRFGWRKTREHSGVLFKAVLVIFAVQVLGSIVGKVLEGTVLGVLATLAITVVSFFLGVGLTKIALKIAKGAETSFEEIWPKTELVWRYFLASLLTAVIVALGFVLLIVPGVYFALRFSMVRFAILDGAGVLESLGKSSKMTQGHLWHLLGFFLVVGVLNLLGAILFFVGLLVTVPVTVVAYAHVYQKLHAHHGPANIEAK